MRHLLADRNFRRLFVGRLVTNAGDSLYYVAAMWLVWKLTSDPVYTGVAGFLTMGPSALQFLLGPLVDRWDVRRILVGTQAVQAVLVLAIPLAAYTGHLTVWVVLTVMPVLSLLNQFVYPAQSAALPRIVEQEDLVDANSAFSLAYQGVDMVFNATGGILVAVLGAVTLYAVDSVTFLAAAATFAGVRIPPAADAESRAPADASTENVATDGGEPADTEGAAGGYVAELREGFTFLRGTFLVLVLVGSAFVNFGAGAAMAVLPPFAASIGGASAYGALMAAFAAGNLTGALVAGRLDHLPLGRLTIGAFVASGVLFVAAASVAWFPAVLALFGLATVPLGLTNVLLASVVQSAVPESKLGRVSSLLGSASTAAMPVGTLVGGVVASVLWPAAVLAGFGVTVVVLAGYWLVTPRLRRLPRIGDIDTLDRTAET
ncbi:MFS transporter [Halobacterium wangiae]|uniref:MFS transporter n=1 Tax=Halobacterium wangiae TaxID=2902623 RepID=UPI001E5B673D|nr:MFS transporter [Halobacterium wangiae]